MVSVPHFAGADKVRTPAPSWGDDPPRRQVFTEVLPPLADGKPLALTWEPGRFPGTGLLTITSKRHRCPYLAYEFPVGWDGRAVRLTKYDGHPGSDAEAEGYDVYLAHNGRDHRCDCKGHEYHGRCKHVLAVAALVENRWLELVADDAPDPGLLGNPPF